MDAQPEPCDRSAGEKCMLLWAIAAATLLILVLVGVLLWAAADLEELDTISRRQSRRAGPPRVGKKASKEVKDSGGSLQ